MIDHKHSSDASAFRPVGSNGYEAQTIGSAQCGNLADFTANSTFILVQTTYHPLPLFPGPVVVSKPALEQQPT